MASQSIPRTTISPYVVLDLPSDYMAPTLETGDLVEVDTTITAFEGEGLYLLAFPLGEPALRRLSRAALNGHLRASTDAAPHDGVEVDADALVIVGKARRAVRISLLG